MVSFMFHSYKERFQYHLYFRVNGNLFLNCLSKYKIVTFRNYILILVPFFIRHILLVASFSNRLPLVFKVFSITDEEFIEICNLRVGKNLNLNFSCNDVAWNTIDDNYLATAATNGAVVLWNLNKTGRSKQEHVFVDHKRTVNKVSFHATEASWLISGSQDGTMKCFDLRTKEAVKTFLR